MDGLSPSNRFVVAEVVPPRKLRRHRTRAAALVLRRQVIAEALEIMERAVQRDWKKAWLILAGALR